MPSAARIPDRRVQKTLALLSDALTALIREKPYDSITVQDILDRANVGRSTFYMHFRDKDDLLAHAIRGMLGLVDASALPPAARRADGILWFSLPIFAFVDRHRRADAPRMGPKGRAVIHEHLEKVIAELIADDVGKVIRGRRKGAGGISPDLLVRHVVSTFVLVLNWWVESGSPLSAERADALFRSLISPTLDSIRA